MKTRIMLDCETLSTPAQGNAALLSISAVSFNLHAKNAKDLIDGEFERYILIDDAFASGHVDPKTVLWWMRQGEIARRAIYGRQGAAVPEHEALAAFNRWITTVVGDNNPDDVELWSNDELADALWVKNAMERNGLTPNWPWWGVRCFRTLNSLFPSFRQNTKFDGTPHVGLDDATHQAKVLWRIVNEGMASSSHLYLGENH